MTNEKLCTAAGFPNTARNAFFGFQVCWRTIAKNGRKGLLVVVVGVK